MRSGESLVLELEDGGQWALDLNRSAHALVGRRVRLEGIRSGFNLIDVDRIERA